MGKVVIENMNPDKKLIVVNIGTKEALDKAKEVPYETYDSVVRRALKALRTAAFNDF